MPRNENLDPATVEGFGREWATFDQSAASEQELDALFMEYFGVFPWDALPEDAAGFDLGCGSGRWARRVAERVAVLHCIDASQEALDVARRNLRDRPNCRFHHASVESVDLAAASMDFGYALGVLHHAPDTAAGVAACARLLKPGAPLLLYLYYAFENRPAWYRSLWRLSDALRRRISRWPHPVKLAVSTVIAALVYLPLARLGQLAERIGIPAGNLPLTHYRRRSFYTMRTDSYDRFSTRVEHRFSRTEISAMMDNAGLERIRFSDSPPYWCAVGFRRG